MAIERKEWNSFGKFSSSMFWVLWKNIKDFQKLQDNDNEVIPTCESKYNKKNFVSEVCAAVQQSSQDGEVSALEYCKCPKQNTCSQTAAPNDPYTYATIDNVQYKTCISKTFIPICPVQQMGIVAKIWYGEDLPLRTLVHCRCPSGYTWGELKCTSSGRICYAMACDKVWISVKSMLCMTLIRLYVILYTNCMSKKYMK